MTNIEDFRNGFVKGRDFVINKLKNFYNDNYENGVESPFACGYNMALNHMLDVIQDILEE